MESSGALPHHLSRESRSLRRTIGSIGGAGQRVARTAIQHLPTALKYAEMANSVGLLSHPYAQTALNVGRVANAVIKHPSARVPLKMAGLI
jgi:hypothetical protein